MLDVLQNSGNSDRSVRDVHEILRDINMIKSDGDKKGPSKFPVSALTNADRNSWTKNRELLLEEGNKNSLSAIDDAMFCLSLDDFEHSMEKERTKTLVAGKILTFFIEIFM